MKHFIIILVFLLSSCNENEETAISLSVLASGKWSGKVCYSNRDTSVYTINLEQFNKSIYGTSIVQINNISIDTFSLAGSINNPHISFQFFKANNFVKSFMYQGEFMTEDNIQGIISYINDVTPMSLTRIE